MFGRKRKGEKMSKELFDVLSIMFGKKAARQTRTDVRKGKISEKTLWKYL